MLTDMPIKLTDQMLSSICVTLWATHPSATEVARFERAVRELRGRARAVVLNAQRGSCDDCCSEQLYEVGPEEVDALREVPP